MGNSAAGGAGAVPELFPRRLARCRSAYVERGKKPTAAREVIKQPQKDEKKNKTQPYANTPLGAQVQQDS